MHGLMLVKFHPITLLVMVRKKAIIPQKVSACCSSTAIIDAKENESRTPLQLVLEHRHYIMTYENACAPGVCTTCLLGR